MQMRLNRFSEKASNNMKKIAIRKSLQKVVDNGEVEC